ncbi:hypothetical protein BJY04DRAFT_221964 [Aspergillus karnatakaensis]|uniref:F-box protein n=1 Tax=Aspergillus karnatakaensis TaxID=1810916 RepID=UPI003CCD9020
MTSITSLPPEILYKICHLLPYKDLYPLRLTCKTLASKTHDLFASREFSEIYLALTTEGLQFLEDLASNETFRGHLKKLWIFPNLFKGQYNLKIDNILRFYKVTTKWKEARTPRERLLALSQPRRPTPPITPGYCVRWAPKKPDPTPADERRYKVYQEAVSDHFQLVLGCSDSETDNGNATDSDSDNNPSPLEKTLTTCLPRFPNLHSIGIKDYTEFSAQDRRIKSRWRGVCKLRENLGFNPLSPMAFTSWAQRPSTPFSAGLLQSRIFSTLIVSLGNSGVPIETLETGNLLVDDALSLTATQEDRIRPFIRHLQGLSLDICSSKSEQRNREKL